MKTEQTKQDSERIAAALERIAAALEEGLDILDETRAKLSSINEAIQRQVTHSELS
jgi:septal ring factor EnvC (AmiA/AmiB activator)